MSNHTLTWILYVITGLHLFWTFYYYYYEVITGAGVIDRIIRSITCDVEEYEMR